ncbi:cytochrome P450 [Exophiala viscosa]|uniref:Cytochrome P450 n=1 Tax=Exophiala viscosa TaxID=2486360 RepID=A0AAN6IFE7_9EURO|nr:cytochrome P450 [Exophiala viscosa]
MHPLLWAVAVAIFIVAVVRQNQHRRRIKSLGVACPEPPNVYPIPFGIGRFLYIGRRVKDGTFMDLWPEWWQEYGKTLRFSAFGANSIFTDEPDNVRFILQEGPLAGKVGMGADFHDQWYEFLGDSVFNLDGIKWKTNRAKLRKQFTRERLADLELFEHHVQRMIRFVKSYSEQPVPVLDLLHRFTLDTSMNYMLGTDENTVEKPVHQFSHAWDNVFEIMDARARAGGLWKILLPKKPMQDAMAVLNEVAYTQIDRAVERRKNGEKLGTSFLDAITEDTLDREEIRGHLMTIMLGGRDTAALTLTNTLHALARHPAVYATARAEILEVIGPSEIPTFEQLKKLPYLKAIIDEVLRLWPILPYTRKSALKDCTLPTGGKNREPIAVLADTELYYSARSMHRRPEFWGHDADLFRPERWIESGGNHKPWTYFPFSGGPRICVGMQFAMTEMQYILSRLLQSFPSLSTTQPELEYKMMILMVPKTEVYVTFHDKEA